MVMKNIILSFILICFYFEGFSQNNYDPFVGTWVYQKNDTVFKIKLQKGTVVYKSVLNDNEIEIFGGYSLSVRGALIEDYLKPLPASWAPNTKAPLFNIYINAYTDKPGFLGFTFYDQRIKHVDNSGIPKGEMHLIAPNKLHWILNEKEGLLWRVEGTDIPYELKGFSVPENVIMTKEE